MHVSYVITRYHSISEFFSARKLKLYKGYLFFNAVKVILFISDAQYYVPVKLYGPAGCIYLFKITRKLAPEHVKLRSNIDRISFN